MATLLRGRGTGRKLPHLGLLRRSEGAARDVNGGMGVDGQGGRGKHHVGWNISLSTRREASRTQTSWPHDLPPYIYDRTNQDVLDLPPCIYDRTDQNI
jgi:hypothetical protein